MSGDTSGGVRHTARVTRVTRRRQGATRRWVVHPPWRALVSRLSPAARSQPPLENSRLTSLLTTRREGGALPAPTGAKASRNRNEVLVATELARRWAILCRMTKKSEIQDANEAPGYVMHA